MLSFSTQSTQRQRRRFIQLLFTYFLATLIGIVFASTKNQPILIVSALGMSYLYWLVAYRKNIKLAIPCFLWLITIEISLLMINSSLVYHPIVMCYTLVLMYSALFSTKRVFISLAVFISAYCTVALSLVYVGYWPSPIPRVSLFSVVAVNIYVVIAVLSAWIMSKDFRTLLRELREENQQSERSKQELKRIAMSDALTGLCNRTHAEQSFHNLIEKEKYLAVVFICLDNFKQINDAYGHAIGDIAIKILANRIKGLLTPEEVCSRFDGNEFVLILKFSDPTRCKARYQNFLNTIFEEMHVEFRVLRISASIGVAHYPTHSLNFNELCRKAYQASHHAKTSGRNNAALYCPEWQDEYRKKLDMTQALHYAVENEELFLVYQPKYHLASMEINGVEALLRWQSKEFGLVSPATFIPLAEETGLIDHIGLFVLKQACHDCYSWIQHGYKIPVSVNVSPAQLKSGSLPEHVLSILADAHLAPHYLELEITESMLIQDQNILDSQISTLTEQGVGFAIDDFGTGYSNLHYLSRFKTATLKIDQSFIKQLNNSSQNFNLVKGIIVLAKTLGLTTVAEGVEDQKTLSILRTLDCDSAQGYLLSKPIRLVDLYVHFEQANQDNTSNCKNNIF